MESQDYAALAGCIDHALLSPSLGLAELEAGLELCVAYGVASACIVPHAVAAAARRLDGTGVLASTVIGFPHGAVLPASKLHEAGLALEAGAAELDVVVNISRVRSGDWGYVEDELGALVTLIHKSGARMKVIFETCYLDETQKIRLAQLSARLGVDWVKTSTGFGPGGATDDDLRLLRAHAPPPVQLKASGGIRTLADVLRVRALGATRVGTSATAAILDAARESTGLPAIVAPKSAGAAPSAY
jgi:deoxyribose-phosphate aldolase